jgi:biotin carboxyl carrier protein
MSGREFVRGDGTVRASVRPLGGDRFVVRLGERDHEVAARVAEDGWIVFTLGDRVHRCAFARAGRKLQVRLDGHTWLLEEAAARGAVAHGTAGDAVEAPMTGTVLKVLVAKGDAVAAHAPLVLLSAMKMEHRLVAPRDGVVAEVTCGDGATVQAGDVLVRLERKPAT